MKKLGILLGVLAVLYAIAAVAASLLMPRKIADAEARNFGVRVAIAKMTQDLRKAEARIEAIRNLTRDKGLSKITEAAMILDDGELNRLAMDYLGVEWTGRESEFLEQVVRSRGRLFSQRKRDGDRQRAADNRLRELEVRKQMLSHRLHSPYREQDFEARKQDVEIQLSRLCEYNDGSRTGKKSTQDHAAAWAKNETSLLELAERYESESVEILLKHLADELEMLHWLQDEPARLKGVARVFSLWPFSRISNIPVKSTDEERI